MSVAGRKSRIVAVALLSVGLLAGANASRAQVPQVTQVEVSNVVVVTANLNEAYDAKDVSSMKELAPFARRVMDHTPEEPDALLVQEVRESSAKYVAKRMYQETGHKWVVATPLYSGEPWRATDSRWTQRDVAVLLNTSTMKAVNDGGVITTPDPWGVKDKAMYKEHAYVLAEDKATGTRYAFLSLHFPPSPGSRSSYPKRFAKWTRKIASTLETRFPKATRIVAGDFNQVATGGHRAVLEGFGYSFIEPQEVLLGVDHIFTTGTAGFGGADTEKDIYSDHRFFWGESFVP